MRFARDISISSDNILIDEYFESRKTIANILFLFYDRSLINWSLKAQNVNELIINNNYSFCLKSV